MLSRFHQFRLSLAAKCEVLFGGAVILVIGAAVLVPWLRMEQLTGQLNQQTAQALIQSAVDNHVTVQTARHGAATRPATRGVGMEPATRASQRAGTLKVGKLSLVAEEQEATTTRPASTQPADPQRFEQVHMVLLSAYSEEANPTERRTLSTVDREPSRDFYSKLYRRDEGVYRFRYGKVIFLSATCAQCHEAPQAGMLPRELDDVPRSAFAVASVDLPTQVEPNQLLLNRVFIFTAGALAGTVAIAVFYLIISRLILQPVRILQETAEKVSDGDLDIRTHIPTHDEFQVLSETFNRMLENLKEGEDQLRAINQSLDLKLAEMKESNLALYESNRLKSEFLANVSHELRTPLNSILGFAEILKDASPVAADPKIARYIQNIARSGKHLLDLINDLLDLAKIEAGRMDIRAEPLSLTDLFEGLSSILKPLLEARQLTIKTSVASDVPVLQTDAAKLQQVLYNFLSNAIKFSPNSGEVILTANRAGADHVKILVTDHGPGIEPDKQSLIFEKFRQIDASATREHGGTGLGLSISKELTQLLGGTIGVESVPQQGSTFWVLLPLKLQSRSHEFREHPAPTNERIG